MQPPRMGPTYPDRATNPQRWVNDGPSGAIVVLDYLVLRASALSYQRGLLRSQASHLRCDSISSWVPCSRAAFAQKKRSMSMPRHPNASPRVTFNIRIRPRGSMLMLRVASREHGTQIPRWHPGVDLFCRRRYDLRRQFLSKTASPTGLPC